MDIVVNVRQYWFECVEVHYLPIYGLRVAMNSSRYYSKKTDMIRTYNEIVKKKNLLFLFLS